MSNHRPAAFRASRRFTFHYGFHDGSVIPVEFMAILANVVRHIVRTFVRIIPIILLSNAAILALNFMRPIAGSVCWGQDILG